MKTNMRFIKSIIRTAEITAANPDLAMPWTRGARRAAFVAARNTPVVKRKSA